jgi:hypothetical protein
MLTVFLSLQLNANASTDIQLADTQPEVPSTPNLTTPPTITPTPTQYPQENNTLMTREEALALATPIIEQYAQANNRTIISINATFYPSVRDLGGVRGGLSLEEILAKNLPVSEAQKLFSSYPEWCVSALFQWTKPQSIPDYDENGTLTGGHWPSDATWVFGYTVLIWADTGEIYGSGADGIE